MNEIDEKKIQEALLKGTNEASELKDMVWKNIEKRLNSIEGDLIVMKKPKKSNKLKYGSIAAAFLTVILLANTDYVNAAVNRISELFVPKKTIQQPLEGTNEKTDVELQVSSQKYIIYVDKERYTLESSNGKDIIKPKNLPEGYPEVSMTIEQNINKTPSEVAVIIEKDLKSKLKNVTNEGEVTEPIKGIFLKGSSGNKWNDTVVHYYIVDNQNGGSFIIKEQYFLEAAEGHGARFYNMLKEFKIVND